MNKKLYPLRFKPILKEKVWGGTKLHSFLGKAISSQKTGESWEISTVENSISIVENGFLKGKALNNVIQDYQTDLVGEKVYKKFGNNFPLLIKFIDAQENLSVQLHPNDVLAKERHNSFGKTEMWYIMQADKDSGIIAGFKNGVNKQEYLSKLENGTLTDLLNFEKVKANDAFFIKPGLIHAIGKGVLLAEIQQTSDITYRVYDWNRKDVDGEKRELHTELAEDAIDFSGNNQFKIPYNSQKKNKPILLADNIYFKTHLIQLAASSQEFAYNKDSFKIFMGVEGETELSGFDFSEVLRAGETILLPASITKLKLSGKDSKVLEVSI